MAHYAPKSLEAPIGTSAINVYAALLFDLNFDGEPPSRDEEGIELADVTYMPTCLAYDALRFVTFLARDDFAVAAVFAGAADLPPLTLCRRASIKSTSFSPVSRFAIAIGRPESCRAACDRCGRLVIGG